MSRTLATTGFAVAACAALGSVASREVGSRWHRALRTPAIQPPPGALPIVWTALHAAQRGALAGQP